MSIFDKLRNQLTPQTPAPKNPDTAVVAFYFALFFCKLHKFNYFTEPIYTPLRQFGQYIFHIVFPGKTKGTRQSVRPSAVILRSVFLRSAFPCPH